MPYRPAVLVLFFSLLTACTGVIGGDDPEACGDRCDQGFVAGAGSDSWANDLMSMVDEEYQRLSTYASNDGGWGACVSTWTVSGAAVGELASKTCVLVGVAAIETGVGGVVAGVCAGADVVQADALLGAAAGYVSGYLACSAASFPNFLSSFRLFSVGSDSESEPQSDVEEWNTPECAARYDEYKAVCGQPSSCNSQTMICEEYIDRYYLNIRCAELRNSHMYDCPHPESYNWDTHQDAVSDAYLAAQNCQTKLCDSSCYELIDSYYLSDYAMVCNL